MKRHKFALQMKSTAALFTILIMAICVMPMAGLPQALAQNDGNDLNSAESIEQISRTAQEVIIEAQHRREKNPADIASARQPLIDFMSINPPEMIPLVMYQMLGQLWYSDKNAMNSLEDARIIFKAGHEAYPEDEMLLLNYAMATFELKYFADAAPLFEQFYEISAKHEVKYLSYAAAAYYTAGNGADAKRIFLKMMEISQTPDPKWLKSLIDICTETGDFNEAERYKAQLVDLNSQFNEKYDDVFNLDSIDEPPKAIRVVPPKYPFEAKEEKIEGRVVVELIVTKDGIPYDERVVDAEPPDVFEEAALETIEQYQFVPAKKNGEAVDVRVRIPIKFALDEGPFKLDPEAKALFVF